MALVLRERLATHNKTKLERDFGINPFETVKEDVALSPEVPDEVKTSTCYMCACRCGIKVHPKNNQIRYIEGIPEHPVNKGVLCAKGSAGPMHQHAPAKLTKPLLRVGGTRLW